MGARQKATGWKVPLLFCAVILGLVALASLWRAPRPAPPELPQELVAQARALSIDLETPEGRPWKERIVQAASGFVGQDVKSARLAALAAEASRQGRFDAACAAAVQAPDEARRNAAFAGVFEAAAEDCASLPWAVFAVHGVRAPELASELALALERRWRTCQGSRPASAP